MNNLVFDVNDLEQGTGYKRDSGDMKPEDFNNDVSVSENSTSETISKTLESEPSQISTERLYSAEEIRAVELSNSIRLLTESLSLAEEALNYFKDGDLFGSEDCMQKIHMLLPELFCCRKLGKGFEMSVMALYHSYNGRDDKPYNETQIFEVKHFLRVLLDEPYLKPDLAVERILNLEETGLEVNPERIDPEKDEPENRDLNE